MVTTNNQRERIVHAMTKGANEYIMKPFTKEILHEKLSLLGLIGKDRG
jgi:two-component system chemotaxis response regulator CheY